MIGKTLSHFKILEKLGAGGMGEVFLAEDLNLKRKVALKVLPDESFKETGARERFRREARAASALNHPHICTIHEIGDHDGRPFIVMEYLKGRTVKEITQSGSLPTEALLKIGQQVADALSAAHAEGIIHRDIKPANIFINERGDVKVLDFGLAKLRQPDVALDPDSEVATLQKSDLTRPGSTVGTVAYMSPEQVLGKTIDARTDVFSLGVVLYEVATGAMPFRGETSGAIFDQILHGTPTSPIRLKPDLPVALDQIITRCLEKDPQDRYTSADLCVGLEENLKAFELTRAGLKRRTGAAQPILARERRVFDVIILVSLVIGLGYFAWTRFAGEPKRPGTTVETTDDTESEPATSVLPALAVLPFESRSGLEDDRVFADGIHDELRTALSRVSGLKVFVRPR